MKLTFVLCIIISLMSCQEKPKTKAQDNLKTAADTSKQVDTKKKALLNNRF